MTGPIAALHHGVTASASGARPIAVALARAAHRAGADHTSRLLVLGVVLVGIAAVWLVVEVHRAWSPESLRADHRTGPSTHETDALRQVAPLLVNEVAQLRREVADLRAADARRVLTNLERVRDRREDA